VLEDALAKKLQLSFSSDRNPYLDPILVGGMQPDGMDLQSTVMQSSRIFWYQLHEARFDISEMSISSYLISLARGDDTWVGLPIFHSHHFFHTWSIIRTDAGIERPEDLKGKRMGVMEYQMTAAVWMRGALLHEFGVAPEDMEWWMERTEQSSHGGATGFKAPPGVKLNRIPEDTNIGVMMSEGQLDAAVFYHRDPASVDRSRIDLMSRPDIRHLFPDAATESERYYQSTGLHPVNHCIVVRRSLLEKHPWIALNVFRTFRAAKDDVVAQGRQLMEPYFQTGAFPSDRRSAVAADPLPYGVKANQKLLETVTQYVYEQGLTARKVEVEEMFAPSTLGL
jgi:4,5-dihydroxyphthalate decarboxylase